jgi:hypothetical protein
MENPDFLHLEFCRRFNFYTFVVIIVQRIFLMILIYGI